MLESQDAQTTPFIQLTLPMPAINPRLEVDPAILGTAVGVLSDGVPFAPELWENATMRNVTFLLPYQEILFADDEEEDPLVSQTSNITGFHYRTEGEYFTAITVGMGILEEELAWPSLFNHIQYLQKMELVGFLGEMENGSASVLLDFAQRRVVRVSITLVDDGEELAITPLEFTPIPGSRPKLTRLK